MLADIVCVATITLMTKLKKDLITTAKQTKKTMLGANYLVEYKHKILLENACK